MSEVNVIAAIIEQNASAFLQAAGSYSATRHRVSAESAIRAAEALWNAGYRKGVGTVDRDQDARLKGIESRLDRVEGYMVIPAPIGTNHFVTGIQG